LSEFVLDTSSTLVLVLDDEPHSPVQALLDAVGAGDPVVPPLWPYEVASGLESARKRGRLTPADVAMALGEIGRMRIEHDDRPADILHLTNLAAHLEITPYDAAYVSLATARGIPLATQDRRLARVGRAIGIDIIH
jgi:predicted nucleic acid-binding protein